MFYGTNKFSLKMEGFTAAEAKKLANTVVHSGEVAIRKRQREVFDLIKETAGEGYTAITTKKYKPEELAFLREHGYRLVKDDTGHYPGTVWIEWD